MDELDVRHHSTTKGILDMKEVFIDILDNLLLDTEEVLPVIALASVSAVSAFIWAWPMLHIVNFVAHSKPLFWPTFRASFYASFLGLGCVILVTCLIFFFCFFIFGLGSGLAPKPIQILPAAMYFFLHAAFFRLFLRMPEGTRICYVDSMIVSLLPMIPVMILMYLHFRNFGSW